MDCSYCSDCKRETDVVIDYRCGDTICSECGLVIDSHYIQETIEWRKFAEYEREPNRVGSPSNPLLENLDTVNPSTVSGNFLTPSLHSKRSHDLSTEAKSLTDGFKTISQMAERLGLVSTIKDRACEIYKEMEDKNIMEGKKHYNLRRLKEAYPAACLLIASKDMKLSRTLKEISTVAGGVSKKNMSKALKIIKEHLEVQTGPVHAGELARRFCSRLGMDKSAIKAVEEAVRKSEEIDVRRTQQAVLGAIIYMVTQLSDAKVSLQDISAAAEVAECTIKRSYKDLSPYVSYLIPNWYATEEDISRIAACP